jgi:hypothetical protein
MSFRHRAELLRFIFWMRLIIKLCFFLLLSITSAFSQDSRKPMALADADSNFVRSFELKRELRILYGLQGNNLSIGSVRDGRASLNGDLYRNTNDYLGAGITYGWLDGDLSFALPGTTYLKEERSNLKQFKFGLSHTRRKLVFRWYYMESKGAVLSSSDNEFESSPSIHEVRLGMQATYIFNWSRYSYRASMYQSEYQLKTAGSFLLRLEPFYRDLGTKDGSIIPEEYDLSSRFAEKTGLEYVKAPGLLLLPGYGINVVIPNSRFFISPIIFAGFGFAHNSYDGNMGKESFTSLEYSVNFYLNAGYNGNRSYSKISVTWSAGYAALDPAYLTSSNVTIMLTYGLRFQRLRNIFK